MRWLPVLCYLGIAGWQVGANFDAIWPREPAIRAALQECFLENHRFDPLDGAARTTCLRSHAAPTVNAANAVDLWHAQGQGLLRGDDIRRLSMVR